MEIETEMDNNTALLKDLTQCGLNGGVNEKNLNTVANVRLHVMFYP